MPDAPRLHRIHALAVYAESLIVGRRVAVLGDASGALRDRLIDLGARTVLVAGVGELASLHGRTVDVAFVADLSLFPHPDDALALVRSIVGDHGVAIVASPNGDAPGAENDDALDYYELFDLVAHEFGEVKMVAQLSFHGVTLAELGDEDESPRVSVDTQLAPADRAPEMFVAVASERAARFDPYAIIELPPPAPPVPEPPEQVSREDDAARLALAQAQLRAESLEAQLDELRAQHRDAETARRAAEDALDQAQSAHALRFGELERALEARLRDTEGLGELVEALRANEEAARTALVRAEGDARRADAAERALTVMDTELSRAVDAHGAELAHYEGVLRERAQAIRVLEGELVRREGMVRDLVGALEEHATVEVPPRAPVTSVDTGSLLEENASLRARLDALALDLARREGEGRAAAWSVSELERRLESVERRGAATPASVNESGTQKQAAAGDGPGLAALQDELDALRRALVQEHDARARAESGEELARARAEIQRQAVLLQQLQTPEGLKAEVRGSDAG